MNLPSKAAFFGSIALYAFSFSAKAQNNQLKTTFFEGIISAGYIDRGAIVNCTGPAIKYNHKPFTLMIGMLPSLKIKKDKVSGGAPRNAMVIPSLGFGATAVYKHIALQIPFLYNSKSATADGRWNPGIALGYKF